MKRRVAIPLALAFSCTPALAAQQSVQSGASYPLGRDDLANRSQANFTELYGRQGSRSLRFAADRGEISANQTTAGTNSVRVENRKLYNLGGTDYCELRVIYTGYWISSATGNTEVANGNDQTVFAALEFPVNGTMTTRGFTFNKLAQGTNTNGTPEYVSDAIYPWQFGLARFSANTQFYIRDERDVTNGQLFNRYGANNNLTGESTQLSNGASAQQYLGTGALTTPTSGAAQNRNFGPNAVVGAGCAGAPADIAELDAGDSILFGVNDAYGNGSDGSNGGGWLARALHNVNGRSIPSLHMSLSNSRGYAFVANMALRQTMLKYATNFVSNYGTNDYADGQTATQVLSNLAVIWGWARSGASQVQRIDQVPIFPRTNSSDSWASPAQQALSGYETGGNFRDVINAGIQTAKNNGQIDGVFSSLLQAVQDPNNPAIWMTNGVAGSTTLGTTSGTTGDGLHPNCPIILGTPGGLCGPTSIAANTIGAGPGMVPTAAAYIAANWK